MTTLPRQTNTPALAAAEMSGYEPSDAPPRGVAFAAAGLLAGIALSLAIVAGFLILLAEFRQTPQPTTLEAVRQTPPEPRLEISPEADRTRIEMAARQRLTGYGWADRQAGRARIPIGRALDILARQGWPDASEGGGKAP